MEEIIRAHILNHAITRRARPDRAWGSKRFEVEATPESFKPIAEAMDIRRGVRVIHTHTTSDHYKKILESLGARVDAFDISLDSALRADGNVRNAALLVNDPKLREKYDVAFSFEPTHIFHRSGSIISAAAYIASLMHALKENGKIYIAARAYSTGGSPADGLEAFLETLARNFGLRYRVVENTAGNDWWGRQHFRVVAKKDDKEEHHILRVYEIERDNDAMMRLLEFARRADRIIMNAFKEKGNTKPSLRAHKKEIDAAMDRLRQERVQTVRGERTIYDILREYAERGEAYTKTF